MRVFTAPADRPAQPGQGRTIRTARIERSVAVVVAALLVLTLTAGCYVARSAVLPGVSNRGATSQGDTAHLQPALARAIAEAIAQARADGVELRVTSGWRSPAEQQRLFDAAVKKYGSARAASHWVLPPSESAHVRGEAVDVGPRSGATWLEKHGKRLGLCRRYDNEWWHFELLVPAGSTRCPVREPYAGA